MEEAKRKVEEAITDAVAPAVLWSGGRDSSLLLRLAHTVRNDITAIHFATGIATDMGLIRQLGIACLSWPAADTYLLSDGDRRVRVQEFDFGGARLPVVTDLEAGTTCSRLPEQRLPFVHAGFDVLLWGVRDSDEHWLKGALSFPPDGYVFGGARLYAPLRHLRDRDIPAVENAPADALGLCTACFDGGHVWCPARQQMIAGAAVDWSAGLTAFRQRMEVQ